MAEMRLLSPKFVLFCNYIMFTSIY